MIGRSAERHMVQLDGLRAIAAIAVLIQHSLPIPGYNLGIAGVKLFFVLSGFLITGILLRERVRVDAQRSSNKEAVFLFYARRCLRILPLYYAALLLACLLGIPRINQALPFFILSVFNISLVYMSCRIRVLGFWQKYS